MYLKRLEIQGFKSFARKTVLEFAPGVTSIVGPNGSGKSNVADSLRWVLGEQSNKLLRGKKGEDVIFAGSDKKVKLSFAEVTATLDNADHKIPLDSSEVSIGRRIDRSGASEYLINGNRVRLLDIIELVLKSNIGTSHYTVIGQGTIDNMILSGPAEIKGLIDEASGVKAYYLKREKTLRRLEQTANNLVRAEDLLSELEPRVKSLRRQAKKMEARESLEQELKANRQQYLAAEYWQLRQESDKLAKDIAGMQKMAQHQVEKKIEQLESQLLTAEIQSQEAGQQLTARQKILSDLEQKLQNLYEQLQQPESVDSPALEHELLSLNADFSKLEQALASSDGEVLRQAAVKLLDLWKRFQSRLKNPKQTSVNIEELKQELVRISSQKDSLVAELGKLSIVESKAKLSADFLHQQLAAVRGEVKGGLHGDLEIQKAKLDTHLETVTEEIHRVLGADILAIIQKEPVPPVPLGLPEKIEKLQRQLDLIGGVDELTLQEYHETEQRYNYLNEQTSDLKKGIADLGKIIEELDEHIKLKFNEAFHKVREKFENYFRLLFNGGRAYLSVLRESAKIVESEEEEEAGGQETQRPEQKLVNKYEKGETNIIGVDIKATPPGKKLSSIQALSGGERALTSIALLCSLLASFPSPFVVLDEVDAALDEANTIRFGGILSSLSGQTQFITITHNRETMAQSDILYGITMGDDGISKLLSIKLEQAGNYAQ